MADEPHEPNMLRTPRGRVWTKILRAAVELHVKFNTSYNFFTSFNTVLFSEPKKHLLLEDADSGGYVLYGSPLQSSLNDGKRNDLFQEYSEDVTESFPTAI